MTGTTDADCVEPASFTGIDLLVLYPTSLAGSPQAVLDYASTRTNQANTVFWRSGAKVQYNLVRVAPLTGEQPPEPPPLQEHHNVTY
jgi:hypothetical protein